MSSRRQSIIEALKARVEDITIAHGYQTNAGLNVTLNEVYNLGAGNDDPDVCVAMLLDEDQLQSFQGEHVRMHLPIRFIAIAKGTLAAPHIAAETVLADVKKAIEQTDRTYGRLIQQGLDRGNTATLEREAGHMFVGVVISYVAKYAERWGYPDV